MEDPAIWLLKEKLETREKELAGVMKQFYDLRHQIVYLSDDIVRMTNELRDRMEQSREVR